MVSRAVVSRASAREHLLKERPTNRRRPAKQVRLAFDWR